MAPGSRAPKLGLQWPIDRREANRWTLALALAAVVATGMTVAPAKPPPGAPTCSLFPADNHWNRRVDRLPVHPRSSEIVASVGRQETLHPDFGSGSWGGGPIGIPYTTVAGIIRRCR